MVHRCGLSYIFHSAATQRSVRRGYGRPAEAELPRRVRHALCAVRCASASLSSFLLFAVSRRPSAVVVCCLSSDRRHSDSRPWPPISVTHTHPVGARRSTTLTSRLPRSLVGAACAVARHSTTSSASATPGEYRPNCGSCPFPVSLLPQAV